jgi:hypothetical protein
MRSIAMIGALAVLAAAPLAAQGNFRTGSIDPARRTPTGTSGSVLGDILGTQRDSVQRRKNSDKIPPGQLPPAGMCRIWIDGVPPGRQPAPTDCQTAVATKPANARVIWGDQSAFPGKGEGKFNKGKGKSGKGGDADDSESRRRSGDLGSVLGRSTGKNPLGGRKNSGKGKGRG